MATWSLNGYRSKDNLPLKNYDLILSLHSTNINMSDIHSITSFEQVEIEKFIAKITPVRNHNNVFNLCGHISCGNSKSETIHINNNPMRMLFSNKENNTMLDLQAP